MGFEPETGANLFATLNNASGCSVIRDDNSESLAVIFATRIGGIDIVNRADVFDADLELLSVSGFPALLVRPRPVETFCIVAVDVAPGEVVEIQIDEAGRKPTTSQDQLCETARRVAEPVMRMVLGA